MYCNLQQVTKIYTMGNVQVRALDRVSLDLNDAAISAIAHRVARMRDGKIIEIIVNEAPVSPERIEW